VNILKTITLFTAGAATLALVGCASIVDGGPRKIAVKSEPSDAKITVFDQTGKQIGEHQTPTVLSLSRGGNYKSASYRLVLAKNGYETKEIALTSTLNGWYIGNIFFGGLLGLAIVDPLTGAMWTLTPSDVNVVLQNSKTASLKKERDGFVVMLRKDLSPELQERLIPIQPN
jgi:hypothetical protein